MCKGDDVLGDRARARARKVPHKGSALLGTSSHPPTTKGWEQPPKKIGSLPGPPPRRVADNAGRLRAVAASGAAAARCAHLSGPPYGRRSAAGGVRVRGSHLRSSHVLPAAAAARAPASGLQRSDSPPAHAPTRQRAQRRASLPRWRPAAVAVIPRAARFAARHTATVLCAGAHAAAATAVSANPGLPAGASAAAGRALPAGHSARAWPVVPGRARLVRGRRRALADAAAVAVPPAAAVITAMAGWWRWWWWQRHLLASAVAPAAAPGAMALATTSSAPNPAPRGAASPLAMVLIGAVLGYAVRTLQAGAACGGGGGGALSSGLLAPIAPYVDWFVAPTAGMEACADGLFVPGPTPSPAAIALYLFLLLWSFVGVAIGADVFMVAIEMITSQETVIIKQVVNGTTKEFTVLVWNATVANLTLMALGSSAPEILLSVIEIVTSGFYAGELGPSTIVGSAAFNLLVISAVCVTAIPKGEGRLHQGAGRLRRHRDLLRRRVRVAHLHPHVLDAQRRRGVGGRGHLLPLRRAGVARVPGRPGRVRVRQGPRRGGRPRGRRLQERARDRHGRRAQGSSTTASRRSSRRSASRRS